MNVSIIFRLFSVTRVFSILKFCAGKWRAGGQRRSLSRKPAVFRTSDHRIQRAPMVYRVATEDCVVREAVAKFADI